MRVLGIIGAGHVGSHIAYAAGLLHAADVIKICDINEEVVRSQVQDLNDALYLKSRFYHSAFLQSPPVKQYPYTFLPCVFSP